MGKVMTNHINMVIISVKQLWARHVFAARSCCDLNFQGSDPNVACDKASQFCAIV